jgi:hypothetical protein
MEEDSKNAILFRAIEFCIRQYFFEDALSPQPNEFSNALMNNDSPNQSAQSGGRALYLGAVGIGWPYCRSQGSQQSARIAALPSRDSGSWDLKGDDLRFGPSFMVREAEQNIPGL